MGLVRNPDNHNPDKPKSRHAKIPTNQNPDMPKSRHDKIPTNKNPDMPKSRQKLYYCGVYCSIFPELFETNLKVL